MKRGRTRCADCGRIMERLPDAQEPASSGSCANCGASLDGTALSDFANRLARFGLGATPNPLLSRFPESPNAK